MMMTMMTSYVQILNAVKLAHYMKMVWPFSAKTATTAAGTKQKVIVAYKYVG